MWFLDLFFQNFFMGTLGTKFKKVKRSICRYYPKIKGKKLIMVKNLVLKTIFWCPVFSKFHIFFMKKCEKNDFFLGSCVPKHLKSEDKSFPTYLKGLGSKFGWKKIFEIFPFWQSHLHIVVKFRGKVRLRVTGQLLAYVQGATISNGFKIGPFVGSLWFFKVLPNLLPYCPLKVSTMLL